MNILVMMPLQEKHRQQLEASAKEDDFTYVSKGQVSREQLAAAHIILGNLDDPKQAKEAESLRWIQLNSAGTEGYCEPGILPGTVLLTNATGAYGPAISEYMIAGMFMLYKKMHLYYANQLQNRWHREGNVASVEGSRVLVIGLGDIGRNFARRANALGCIVDAVKRRPDVAPSYVERLVTEDQIEHLLPTADIVALSVPSNASTYHILSAKRIALMKQDAVILNVGRGTAVDTEALTKALETGKLRGAYLDVTDPEPLPPNHPLWQTDNVIITPHITGGNTLPQTTDRIVSIMAENLKRFMKKEQLMNVVNRESGYAES